MAPLRGTGWTRPYLRLTFSRGQDFLDASEAKAVALHSFPDSRSFELNYQLTVRDSTFIFRLPRSRDRLEEGDGAGGGAGKGGQDFIYGYVFCRQRRDPRLPRGAHQSSCVLLSLEPLHSMLHKCLLLLGPKYFDEGNAVLADAMACVAEWPDPVPERALQLPFLGSVLNVRLPHVSVLNGSKRLALSTVDGLHGKHENLSFGSRGSALGVNWQGSGPFPDLDIYIALQGVTGHLHALWEIMLLNEPLLAVAPSPGACSSAVAALISLVAPLPYSADFRPYFTVEDAEFHTFMARGSSDVRRDLPRCMGVTNLHFLRALPDFPNTLSVGHDCNAFESSRMALRHLSSSQDRSVRGGVTSRLFQGLADRMKGPASLISEHKQGLWMRSKPILKPDPALLASIQPFPETCGSSKAAQISAANTATIRRHFAELTAMFLEPFVPFFRPAPQLQGKQKLAFAGPQHLMDFNRKSFVSDMRRDGPPAALQKRLQGDWLGLYERFMDTTNFQAWFEQQRTIAKAHVRRNWMRQRMKTDMSTVIPQLDEIQLIDAFATVERQLYAEIDSHSIDDIQSVHFRQNIFKLQRDLQLLYQALPAELQQPILMNRGRTSLMLGASEDGELDEDAIENLSPHLEAIIREARQGASGSGSARAVAAPSPPPSPLARRNSS